MLPSRNRLQAKRILQSPRSVVISSAPVLNKGHEKEKDGSRKSNCKDTHNIQSEASAPASESLARTTTTTSSAAAATTRLAESATGTGDGSSPVDGNGALEGQQYTYVTDESGYTWLYDNAHGQYYYYDNTQGTYVPYNQQGVAGSSNYSGAQSYAPDGGEADAAKVDRSGNNDGETKRGKPHNQRRTVRLAGGQVWEDSTLDDWPTNDYRLFAGDLGPEATSEMLQQTFGKFRTLQRTHVVMDKKTGKSRGYGFLSFGDADDFLAAWKEFNGKYVGSRPIKLRKSTWKERDADIRKVKRLDKRAFLEYKKGR